MALTQAETPVFRLSGLVGDFVIAPGDDDVSLSDLRHLLAHQGAQRVGVGHGIEGGFIHAAIMAV